jgi:hypothetical protein
METVGAFAPSAERRAEFYKKKPELNRHGETVRGTEHYAPQFKPIFPTPKWLLKLDTSGTSILYVDCC